MAGFTRYLDLLRLFDKSNSSWTVPAISEALQIPASTIYRTIRQLTAAGFLTQSSDASYRLGSAFIEYDRLLRLTDPLVRASQPLLHNTIDQAGISCAALLSRLYNDQIMCIADAASPELPFRSSYERGLPMPLTRGATSKAILAQIPARQLTRLIGPASKTTALRAELTSIRRDGFCFSEGEVDPGLTGIAAPVKTAGMDLAASLSLVVRTEDLNPERKNRLTLLIVSAAALLAQTAETKSQ